MESSTRGGFLIAGSLIGFFGFIVPGLYAVAYDPPANSAAAQINLMNLKDFGSFLGGSTGGSSLGIYNGFSGPVDFHITLWALILMFVLGIFATRYDVETGIIWLKRLQKWTYIGSSLLIVGEFIWDFRYNQTPPEIIQKFISDLDGTKAAIAASHYLSGELGFGALILLFGLLLGYVGAVPKLGCALITLFCMTFVGLLIYTKVTTGAW